MRAVVSRQLLLLVPLFGALSGCIPGVSFDTDGEKKPPPQEARYGPVQNIVCPNVPGDDLLGCWQTKEVCWYNPVDFINIPGYPASDPLGDAKEDYWASTIMSYTPFPGEGLSFTRDGVTLDLDGRTALSRIYYENSSCSGSGKYTIYGLVMAYYKRLGLWTTQDGATGELVLIVYPYTYYIDTGENTREYDFQFIDTDCRRPADYWGPYEDVAFDLKEGVPATVVWDQCSFRHGISGEEWSTAELRPEDEDAWNYERLGIRVLQ